MYPTLKEMEIQDSEFDQYTVSFWVHVNWQKLILASYILEELCMCQTAPTWLALGTFHWVDWPCQTSHDSWSSFGGIEPWSLTLHMPPHVSYWDIFIIFSNRLCRSNWRNLRNNFVKCILFIFISKTTIPSKQFNGNILP